MDYKTASGSDITITVPYEYNGETLTLTNFRYSVLDAAGTVLIGPTVDPDFNSGNSSSDITVGGSYNTTTDKYDVRTIECELITTAGTFKVSVFYEIEGDVLKLTVFEDSFMTYAESFLIRKKISEEMHYYDALDDETKVIVLSNAFDRIMELKFNLGDTYTRQCKYNLSDLTLEQFEALDPKFLEALKKSQIAEADHIVEVNPIRDKVRMGVISETIGESSMFFRQNNIDNKSYFPGISDQAYPYLSKYLYKPTGNSQIWTVRRS